MTVEQLVKELQKLPPGQTVVIDLHSEFTEVSKVTAILGFNIGGYISRPYLEALNEDDKLKVRGYIYIG